METIMARYFYQLLVNNGKEPRKHHTGVFLLPTGLTCPTPKETSIQLHFPGFDPINLDIGEYFHHLTPTAEQQTRGVEPGDFIIALRDWKAGENDPGWIMTADYPKLSRLLRDAGWTLRR